MNLRDKLKADMIAAKKSKNKTWAQLLSTVIGEADRIGKNLPDEQIEKIIRKMHDNLINEIGTLQSIAEAEFLEKYLPQLMSEDEIKSEVETIIVDINAESLKDVGRVMGEFGKLFKGKADMKIVFGTVKKLLS